MQLKLTVVLSLVSAAGFASLMPVQSDYYYQLGGDSDLYVPPVNRDQVIVIGGNVNTNTGLNCNVFNPVVSITNTFQDLKNSVAGIPSGVIDNLKGSVAGFPLYKLQQAMPGLYNVLQNASFGAQNEFSLKVQDCQAVKQTLEEGKSPVNSILSVSDSQGWLDAVNRARQGEAIDITKTSKDIAKNGDDYGLPWVHHHDGNSGGRLQKPIEVIKDVVMAGYNLSLTPSRALDDISTPQAKSASFVVDWPTPSDAGEWAVLVLGDIRISHKKEASAHEAKAGLGLASLLHNCPKVARQKTCVPFLSTQLWQLVDKKLDQTEDNLRTLSAANILITPDVITTIQHMPREQQVMTIGKLSEEIAIQNALDKAFHLKRLLQAGLQIQEVQNLKPVQAMVIQALKKLDDEIHSLAFEQDIRKKMMTDTLTLIMNLRHQEKTASLPSDTHEEGMVKQGALYRGKL